MDEFRELLKSFDAHPHPLSDLRRSLLVRSPGDVLHTSGHTSNAEPSNTVPAQNEDGHDASLPGSSSKGKLLNDPDHFQVGNDLALLDQTKARQRPYILLSWWQEMAAILLAFAALLALFATLYTYANRPSPEWPNWISINTIVSLYVAVLKSCVFLIAANGLGQLKWDWFSGKEAKPLRDLVKYDDASRGPVGAVSLLWTIKLSHALSFMGAVITVLASATDPFAQQIIRYYECRVPEQNYQATIPRTNYYIEMDSDHLGALEESMTAGVQNAIINGVFNPNLDPNAQCLTGNCTFEPEYSSVAWCSTCEDVTNRLTFNNVSWLHRTPDYNISETTWNLTTSLPGGLNVTMDGRGPYWLYTSEFAVMGTPPWSKPYWLPYTGDYSTVNDFVLGKRPWKNPTDVNPLVYQAVPGCDTAASKMQWKCRGYGASQCSLYPCVKTYTASINTGVLTETVIGATTE